MKATSTQLPICKVARPAGKKCDLDSIKLPRGRRPRGAGEEKVEVRLKGSHFWGSEGALRRSRTCQPSLHQGSLPNSQLDYTAVNPARLWGKTLQFVAPCRVGSRLGCASSRVAAGWMRWLKDWTAQGKVSPQLSLVISTAPGQLTTVREARTEVRKLVDSAFERGKLVLPVLSSACNEVSSGFQERGSHPAGESSAAKARPPGAGLTQGQRTKVRVLK